MNGTNDGPSNATMNYEREQGASIIEFVVLLPLFLFTLLFLIWFGATIHAKTSLASAVTNGLRLASTRGRGDVIGQYYSDSVDSHFVGIIPNLDAAHASIDARDGSTIPGAPLDARALGLLSHGMDGNAEETMDDLNTATADVFAGYKLFDIPFPEYSYAIAYASQAMRMSVGSKLRFPCDPHKEDGEGCLLCRPVNPITMDDTPFAGDYQIVGKRIALRCDYRPSSFILTPLLRMLSLISGGAFGDNGGFKVISFAERSDRYADCYLKEDCPPDWSVGDPPCSVKTCCVGEPCL